MTLIFMTTYANTGGGTVAAHELNRAILQRNNKMARSPIEQRNPGKSLRFVNPGPLKPGYDLGAFESIS
jgi:hypothetical protein